MIENCPKKRMIIGISFLALLTLLVLIIESRWTSNNPKQNQFVIENNSTCYIRESFIVVQDCHPCTAFEIASKSKGVCVHTHNKEVLKCKSGETVSRSCDKVAWLDARNFYAFQLILSIVCLISISISFLRQRQLDKRSMLKIQRQLGQHV